MNWFWRYSPLLAYGVLISALWGLELLLTPGVERHDARMTKPITPEQAFATQPVIEKHIERINMELEKPWSRQERVAGRIVAMREASVAECEAVEDMFKSAGWSIRFTSDQREGMFLRFIPPSAAPPTE